MPSVKVEGSASSVIEAADDLSRALFRVMPRLIAEEVLDAATVTELHDLRERLSKEIAEAKGLAMLHLASAGAK